MRAVNRKIKNVTNIVAETGDASLVGKLAELRAEHAALVTDQAMAADRAKLKGALRSITTKDVGAMLEFAPISADPDIGYMRRSLGSAGAAHNPGPLHARDTGALPLRAEQ